VQELDTGLAGITILTTLPSRSRSRAAFRLDLLDGRVVKARRFDSVAEAERVERLSRFLDRRCFPKVLALRGAAYDIVMPAMTAAVPTRGRRWGR
jgi:hypothetical protein